MSAEDELGAVFRTSFRPLVAALAVAVGEATAADAVQDAFVQAHRHWAKVRHYDDPAAWIRRVAVHRLANEHRRRRRQQSAVERLDAAPAAALEPADLDLAVAVAALPRGQRLAVCLHYLAGLPVREVADALGVAEGTVKSQLSDARRNLLRSQGVTP